MVSTSPISCTCSECVFKRWFQMDNHCINDWGERFPHPHVIEGSGLREAWSEDLAIGLLPQAAVWAAPRPAASPPLPEAPPAPRQLASAPDIPPGPELFTPRATSSPIEEISANTQPVFKRKPSHSVMKPGVLLLPVIPVRVPSDSAKRQRRKRSDLEREVPAPSNRLHVSNIPFWFTETHLISLFEGCGNPREAEIIYNERGSKGFGFVTFENVEEATRIRHLFDGKELHRRVIEVNFASKRTSRKIHLQPQQPQDPKIGFMQLTPDPEPIGCKMDENQNICVKHKTNRNQIKMSKFNGQPRPSNYKRTDAHQNRQSGQNSQVPFWFQSPPSDSSLMDCPTLIKKGANMPNGEVGFSGQSWGRPRNTASAANANRDAHKVRRSYNFDIQNNINECIEALQQRRQFKWDVTEPDQIAVVQKKLPADNLTRSGLVERRKFTDASPSQLQPALLQQDIEFSKMFPAQQDHRPGPIGDRSHNTNVSFPEPDGTWFLNMNFSLFASLDKQGIQKSNIH